MLCGRWEGGGGGEPRQNKELSFSKWHHPYKWIEATHIFFLIQNWKHRFYIYYEHDEEIARCAHMYTILPCKYRYLYDVLYLSLNWSNIYEIFPWLLEILNMQFRGANLFQDALHHLQNSYFYQLKIKIIKYLEMLYQAIFMTNGMSPSSEENSQEMWYPGW